jgi:hypothetical protein
MQSVVLLSSWKVTRPLSMDPRLHIMLTSWHSLAHQEYHPIRTSTLKPSGG